MLDDIEDNAEVAKVRNGRLRKVKIEREERLITDGIP
jgi:hypothetical protein